MEVMKHSRPDCQRIGLQAQETIVSGLVCRTSAELCCVKQVQERLCNKGKAVAMYVYFIIFFQFLSIFKCNFRGSTFQI